MREELRMELSSALRDFEGPVVLVTHDREEAYQLCSRLVLMDKGKVLAEGPAREVFSRPKTCQAARLTGCRNISRIRRISPWKVEALDWNGLVLETAEKAGGDVKAVGIRTQDLTPVSDGLGVNRIPVKHPRMEEMPFSWQICLENGIWWEMKKQGWRGRKLWSCRNGFTWTLLQCFCFKENKKVHQQPRVPGIVSVRPDTGYTVCTALLPELVNVYYYRTVQGKWQ